MSVNAQQAKTQTSNAKPDEKKLSEDFLLFLADLSDVEGELVGPQDVNITKTVTQNTMATQNSKDTKDKKEQTQ